MPRRHEGNPRADEYRNHMDVELVDLAGVEEGGDQPSAAHHPDVLARLGAQTSGKGLYGLGHEFHAWHRSPGWLPREHVVCELRVEESLRLASLRVVAQKPVVGLAAPQDGVDRRVELAHAVVDGVGPPIEPLDVAVGPGDVAVRARRDVGDDLSSGCHEGFTMGFAVTLVRGTASSTARSHP